jgi:hypothetical protein
MDLVNHTPIPADLRLSYLPNTLNRRGYLTAKATFRIVENHTELDRDHPIDVFSEMQDHELGCLPQDVMVMHRDPFEVMLLGEVEAPEGEELTQRRVTMQVGDVERHLEVFGDRVWDGDVIGDPAPFKKMPLTWERAFGGTARIEIDKGAFIEVCHPMNPRGLGMDVASHANTYAEQLNTPEGYPRYDGTRRLPNVESPDRLISSPDDAPLPACWAPTPLDCGVRFHPALSSIDPANLVPGAPTNPLTNDANRELIRSNLRHAHPDWWIPCPPRGAQLRLDGVCAGAPLEVTLPALRILGDYVVGSRAGTRELIPQNVILFANDRRMTITYRVSFLVHYEEGEERGFRLRTEDGWYGGING